MVNHGPSPCGKHFIRSMESDKNLSQRPDEQFTLVGSYLGTI